MQRKTKQKLSSEIKVYTGHAVNFTSLIGLASFQTLTLRKRGSICNWPLFVHLQCKVSISYLAVNKIRQCSDLSFEMITVNYSVIITVSRQRDWSKLGNFAIVPRVVSACQSGLHSQSQSFKSQFAKAAALNCRLGCRAPADGSLMTGSLMTPSI